MPPKTGLENIWPIIAGVTNLLDITTPTRYDNTHPKIEQGPIF